MVPAAAATKPHRSALEQQSDTSNFIWLGTHAIQGRRGTEYVIDIYLLPSNLAPKAKLLLLLSGAGGFGKIFRKVIVLCDAESERGGMGGTIAALVLGTSRNRNEEYTVCCSH